MKPTIVFSDVDGTLVDSNKNVLPSTVEAVASLQRKGIPFVLASARGPAGLFPIVRDLGVACPIICYSGSMMLDQDGKTRWSLGFSKKLAKEVLSFIEEKHLPCYWNIYSEFRWIVGDKSHWMVKREEAAVRAESEQGSIDSLSDDERVSKLLLISEPSKTPMVESALKERFGDELNICCSSSVLTEVMPKGVSKGEAVKQVCSLLGCATEEAVAFGDNFNDVEMLEVVGCPYLMGNAPEALKERFPNHTDDNDHDGIANALKRIGLID